MDNEERIDAVSFANLERKPEKIACPGCGEPVFFKKGVQKMAHFAHYAHADCSQFSEGETALHLLGKQRLFEWLKGQGLQVEMEAWLPELCQRPDLLFLTPVGNKVVIEYQCSPISFEDLQKRTEGYRSKGYEVLWICGVDYRLNQTIMMKQLQFFQYSERAGYVLTTYNSSKNEISVSCTIDYNSNNQCQQRIIIASLSELSWEQLLRLYQGAFSAEKRVIHPRRMPLQSRNLLLHRKDPLHRRFLEQVYLMKSSLKELPNWLFEMPTKTLFYTQPCYIWKLDFLYWIQVSQQGIFHTVELKEYIETLPISYSIFIEKDILLRPFYLFFQELQNKKIIQQTKPGIWKQRKKL